MHDHISYRVTSLLLVELSLHNREASPFQGPNVYMQVLVDESGAICQKIIVTICL